VSLDDDVNSRLRVLKGKVDVISCGLFLLLFDWDTSKKAAKLLVELTSDVTGHIFCGENLESEDAREVPLPSGLSETQY
jgi:hypothetical protein